MTSQAVTTPLTLGLLGQLRRLLPAWCAWADGDTRAAYLLDALTTYRATPVKFARVGLEVAVAAGEAARAEAQAATYAPAAHSQGALHAWCVMEALVQAGHLALAADAIAAAHAQQRLNDALLVARLFADEEDQP